MLIESITERMPTLYKFILLSSFLASILYDLIRAEGNSSSVSNNQSTTTFITGPYLDGNGISNVTTQISTHAYLPCKVKQLGNKSVSWVRVRDDHILTVDRMTFIADERFQSFFVEATGIWTLQIKYVQARDAGLYECQVSTEPKVSARVHLHVVVPRTELIGDPDRYVKAGSTVIFRCVVRGALEQPSYIIWYHGSQQVYVENRRGWKVTFDRDNEGETHSSVGTLIIDYARKQHSGNYSCAPSNSAPVQVTLHVINGESSASAVTSACSPSLGLYGNLVPFVLSFFLLIQT